MIELLLIGIGMGNPEQLTLQAVSALNSADLILIPRKGEDKSDLATLRRQICHAALTNPDTRIVEFDLPQRDLANPGYRAGVDDWHDAIAAVWRDMIIAHAGQSGRVALLIWGDPSLYDSSLRIADRVRAVLPLAITVIPGITAIQALTASHAIPLNDIGAPVLVTTGRRLRETGWPPGVATVVVMLDGDCAFQTLPPDGIHIWWGAYIGMDIEIIEHGPLPEAGPRILARRAEARARHGWIMDVYLLRRA